MIFNDNGQGALELRRLTGNYYAGNDFSAIEMDIADATDDIISVVGRAVYELAEGYYHSGSAAADEIRLVELVQRPVAIMACLNYFRRNDVSHEDSGRKTTVSSDGTNKIPWEWQLDRDDAVHLELYYKSVERLIRFLNESGNAEWQQTEFYKLSKSLLISSGAVFDRYFPIDKSERLYVLLVNFIREIQLSIIQPAYGSGWEDFVASDTRDNVMFAARKALALFTMSTALRRLPLQLIPVGVVRRYNAENGMSASEPAGMDDVRNLSSILECDAYIWLDRMKVYRDDSSEEYPMLPQNDRKNKFLRL